MRITENGAFDVARQKSMNCEADRFDVLKIRNPRCCCLSPMQPANTYRSDLWLLAVDKGAIHLLISFSPSFLLSSSPLRIRAQLTPQIKSWLRAEAIITIVEATTSIAAMFVIFRMKVLKIYIFVRLANVRFALVVGKHRQHIIRRERMHCHLELQCTRRLSFQLSDWCSQLSQAPQMM